MDDRDPHCGAIARLTASDPDRARNRPSRRSFVMAPSLTNISNITDSGTLELAGARAG